MNLVVVTPPVNEPVSLGEAKVHLRIDDYGDVTPGQPLPHPDDDLVKRLISTARSKCEHFCRRAFVTTTYTMGLDRFPACIRLPIGRLQAVDSITYVDTNGVQQTLPPADYQVDTLTEPARIAPAAGKCWPSTQYETLNAVRVNFTAGYGSRDEQPTWVKDAILLTLGDLYRFRGEVVTGTTVARIPEGAEYLMWTHRLWPE